MNSQEPCPLHALHLFINEKTFNINCITIKCMDQNDEKPEDKRSIEQKIKEDILNSGFPLEIRTAVDLQRHDYIIFPNERYLDPDKKEHELDILAIKTIEIEQQVGKESIKGMNVFCLIVECKKSFKKPWVFFTRKKNFTDMPRSLFRLESNCGVNRGFRFTDSSQSLFDKINFSSLHFFNNNQKSTSYAVAFTKDENDRSRQIYDAVISVMKALNWKSQEKRKQLGEDGQWATPINWFFFPIIILEGELFEANVSESDVDITKTVRTQLIFNSEKSNLGSAIIDIIKKEDFNHLLSKIESDIEILKKELSKIELIRK